MSERARRIAFPGAQTPPPSPWAMASDHLEAALALARVRQGFWDDDDDDDEAERPYEVRDGAALLSLVGPMTKRTSFWSWYFGGCGTQRVKEHVRHAAASASVSGILLSIDSPGGTIDGTAELADEIAAAAKVKPVHVYVDGMACSAAYWVASQAKRITAPRTALLANIGTYSALVDSSDAAKQMGYKVIPIKAGSLKAAGMPGTPVTKEQIEAAQRLVDSLNAHFLDAVSRGRGIDAKTIASWEGEIFTGDKALSLKLVDAIGTYDDALTRLRADIEQRERRNRTTAPWGAGGKSMDAIDTFRSLLGLGPREPGADTDQPTQAGTQPNPAAANPANPAANPAANAQPDAAAQVVALTAQVTAMTAQVNALNQQVQTLTAERDAFRATADEYAALVRQAAFSECVRALGQERAAQEADRILGPLATGADGKPKTGADGKPTGERDGARGLSIADAKTIRDTYKAAADARFGINPEQGATRVTTVAALPTLSVTASDVEGEDAETKRIRAKARERAGAKTSAQDKAKAQ